MVLATTILRLVFHDRLVVCAYLAATAIYIILQFALRRARRAARR
jgi:hypothetical protein